jgi:hypothetical protein
MPKKNTTGSGRFSKGASGNPAGRPLGSRNHATLLMESLLQGQAEQLIQKTIDMALAGDTNAMRLCLDRIIPARKDRPIQLNLLPVETVQQVSLAVGKVVTAVGNGEITPTEGEVVSNILTVQRDIMTTANLERRVEGIEQKLDDIERRVPAHESNEA